ncbi:MAG: hypothetical protein GX270_15625 [Clostridiaceae bacterium]|jgi:hypothetical protein|nr:hypothetical protein [Clostridiaceae bacterium]
MTRKVLLTTLKVLGIKKSFAAKIIGVKDGTFSSKLKSYKNTAYRFFDDETAVMIAKLFNEKLSINEDDNDLQRIKKTVKTKELADALYNITKRDPFFINEKSYYSSYSNERYYEFIINVIWLEQILCNKYHEFIIENSYQKNDPAENYEIFERTCFSYKKGQIGL